MTRDFERFYALRRRIFNMINLIDGDYHKSYEGALDVSFSFPSYFESDSTDTMHYSYDPPELVKIELHCYLLCSGRHEEFVAESFGGALDQLELWVEKREDDINADSDL